MSFRGSLRACIAAMVSRYANGEERLLTITANDHGNYYTLLTPAELECALERIERTNQRIVLSMTPGELSSMAQTPTINLFDEATNNDN